MIDKEAIEKSGSRTAHELDTLGSAKVPKTTKRKQKEHLKTLVENSSVSRVRNTGRIIKYGASSFRRNIWLSIAATLVTTITFIILLVTIGASLLLSATADAMRQKIDITIYFDPTTSLDTLHTMASTMKTDPNVKSVEVADANMRCEQFKLDNVDKPDVLSALEDPDTYAALLASMQATMRVKVYTPDDLDSIKHIVDTDTVFQTTLDSTKKPTYDVNRTQIENINSWATIAQNGGLILSAIFLIISILVIFNTVRMAIFSRREEIYMMKLVGADPSFIRGPFLIEAEICGIISGILASTAAYFGFQFISGGLASYGIDVATVSSIMTTNKLVLVYLGVIAAGILVSSISARLAMKKYLK